MKQFVISLLVNGLVVYVLAKLLPGVHVNGFISAVLFGLVLGVVNYFVKPILSMLTLPITILTFGLFLLILNGLMVMLASWLLDGFHVDGLVWAMLFGILLSMVNTMFGVPDVIKK
ncbi:phage holin family protein [Sphingobacteriales bacterium UPWRP_1]|nr:hypothetical protein B6N25_10915 [Sphingobacteriales bacterium TSM_CSS]PSJ75650.1 phage holin family protein [Sphingobacteriales bacterium UPWRP_1]